MKAMTHESCPEGALVHRIEADCLASAGDFAITLRNENVALRSKSGIR
jgi:hypothetical protein